MKLIIVIWDTLYHTIASLSRDSSFETIVFSERELDTDPESMSRFRNMTEAADVLVLHRTTHSFWEEVHDHIAGLEGKSIVCFGQDPSQWELTNVQREIATTTYSYIRNGGKDNLANMFAYLENVFLGNGREYLDPVAIPWHGIVHPNVPDRIFDSTDEYLDWYPLSDRRLVGMIISRSLWVSEQCNVEEELITELEGLGLGVLPVMTNSLHDEEMGSKNILECIETYLIRDGAPLIGALVKMVTFLIGKRPELDDETSSRLTDGILSSMNVPVFQPIIALDTSVEEWRDSDGITGDIPWNVTMPEFEGAIEPIMIASNRLNGTDRYNRAAIPGRCTRVARRIERRMSLAQKPNDEKRIAIILNNSPCASVEANIGSAAGLDSHASALSILRTLREAGYSVDVPDTVEELTAMFTERKAHSEFRWTSKETIRDSGGCIYMMPAQQYMAYFSTLPERVRAEMVEAWGEPPGEAMCINGELLVTGLRFGNALVMVQPKRGCMGPKCDGTVCKILHDPECPPSHQYLATYHYIENVFGADAIVHVGTHGTGEFLPGKGIGLSEDCYPDVMAGDIPTFYAYNTDNPPEGSVAKRRIYSTLIGHMQVPTVSGGLYGPFIRLDEILNEYETAKYDPARLHALQHEIVDTMKACGLTDVPEDHDADISPMVSKCHDMLSLMRNSRTETGLHTFGSKLDDGQTRDLIASVVSRSGDPSLPHRIAASMGLDYADLLENGSVYDEGMGVTKGALAERVVERCNRVIDLTLQGMDADAVCSDLGSGPIEELEDHMRSIRRMANDIEASDENGALINALDGGYTVAGPSGYISRGRGDVLPTGRNFYSMDPKRVPTRASWKIGTRLADALLDRYMEDEGDYPESVAFQWMTNDIMAADGEMMAEILSLLGTEPVWNASGHVESFRIVPTDLLVHPRIDVIARISGILRDTFPDRLDLVDSAIRAVAVLDEPDDVNFVAKHVRREMNMGDDLAHATARLFSSKPGTYTSGVNLAVLSGSWTDEKDLASIYISVNGYAYGGGRGGGDFREQFASALGDVSLTFNKVVSDDHDLLGCCCYYSNQGGLTAAARQMSERKVNTYYGDTRERDSVGVRTLSDEIGRVVRSKVLNPKWIEGMKAHGYKGAADMMKKITRVYGWEASTQEVDDAIFDDIADTYINDLEMRSFFERNNPFAAEEISRRLLEAESRGLWDADQDTLDRLRSSYLEIESWMEDMAGGDDIQGGEAAMISPEELPNGKDIIDLMRRIHGRKDVK